MSVSWAQNVVTLTAEGDEIPQPIKVTSIRLVGTGFVADDVLSIVNLGGGEVARYIVGSTENVELLNGCQWFSGLRIARAPEGAWRVLVTFE